MKRLLSMILGCAMILTMAACSSPSTGGTESTAASKAEASAAASEATGSGKKDIKIGVVLKTLSSEYWGYVVAGVRQAEKDFGVTVELQGPPSETSYNEQSNMIETMLSSGNVDAICIAPLQPDMVVTKLQNATIPVLFVDTDVNYDKKITFIGTSNEDAAIVGGKYIAELIGKGKKAVLIGGVQGDTTCEARLKGYREALKAGGVEVLDTQYANGTTDKAVTLMENYMQHFPQIDAVLSTNDDMALGAARAAAQAGKTDIKITGFDGISSGVQSIIDGKTTASVAQSPFGMGYQVVENAIKAVNGEKIEKNIVVPTELINSTNAKDYLAKLNKMLTK